MVLVKRTNAGPKVTKRFREFAVTINGGYSPIPNRVLGDGVQQISEVGHQLQDTQPFSLGSQTYRD